MIYKKLRFFSVITVLMLIAGCKGDTGPAGPSQTGSITGIVELFNADGSMPIDRSGVTVAIQGTSLSTTTDSLGLWTINNVMTGTYTITETKPSYGMSEQQGFAFVGGSEDDNSPEGSISLAQPPNFSVAIDSLKTVTDSGINVWFSMSGSFDTTLGNVAQNEFLLVIGNDSDVNAANPNKYIYSNNDVFQGSLNTSLSIRALDMEYAGLKSGMTAYLVAYPLEHFTYYGAAFSSYFDIATQNTAYTSLGTPSKVFKITIP